MKRPRSKPEANAPSDLEGALESLVAKESDHYAVLTIIKEMAKLESPKILYTALPAYNSG